MCAPQTALEKRVRRHVASKEYTFLAVAQAALRFICRREMESLGFNITGEVDGGVEFTGRLREAWRANLLLHSPSRIYCRAAEFRAGSREELFRKASALPWELWLSRENPVSIQTQVLRSRIRHEGEAGETLFEALVHRFTEAGLEPPGPGKKAVNEGGQKILLRIVDNRAVLSFDTSGEPLYRRGYRIHSAGAPIRETLAAALLLELGWNGDGILVDGMTGSGTFAVEGALLGAGLPPGTGRSFIFQTWPSFQETAWRDVLRKARPNGLPEGPVNTKYKIYACDIDPAAVETARSNAGRLGESCSIRWFEADFFGLSGAAVRGVLEVSENTPGFLVLNPPYGLRLPGGEAPFYSRLGDHIRRNFRGWKTVVLFPNPASLRAFGGGPKRMLSFRHGGLGIQAGFFV
jgi:23S rRNA G2445 N2-methylase RlmL